MFFLYLHACNLLNKDHLRLNAVFFKFIQRPNCFHPRISTPPLTLCHGIIGPRAKAVDGYPASGSLFGLILDSYSETPRYFTLPTLLLVLVLPTIRCRCVAKTVIRRHILPIILPYFCITIYIPVEIYHFLDFLSEILCKCHKFMTRICLIIPQQIFEGSESESVGLLVVGSGVSHLERNGLIRHNLLHCIKVILYRTNKHLNFQFFIKYLICNM